MYKLDYNIYNFSDKSDSMRVDRSLWMRHPFLALFRQKQIQK